MLRILIEYLHIFLNLKVKILNLHNNRLHTGIKNIKRI